MSKILRFSLVPLFCVFALINTPHALSEEVPTTEQPTVLSEEEPPPEPPSIHQRASTCWDNSDAKFVDEPQNCDEVCNTCHWMTKSVNMGKLVNVTYPTLYKKSDKDTVGWDTFGMLQQTCRDCHPDITEHEMGLGENHAIFVKLDDSFDSNFKETQLKLFDDFVLCTTCHSPHQEIKALLRISNDSSSLCLDCHIT